MSPSAPLTVDSLLSTLATKCLGRPLYLHHELPSTNAEAMSLAKAGAAHGTVVVAESQSSGRGRHARVWFSPHGTNVYCSIIARGTGRGISLSEWLSWVPLTTALAVAESVRCVTSIPLALKWPNDLLLHERKVGGILCESSSASATDAIVVIGIGLNVNTPRESFPEELRQIAASLLEASRQSIDRNRLIGQLLFDLEQNLDELQSHGPARSLRAYTTRCSTLGRRVRILLGDKRELSGTAEAISADGALQVRLLSPSPSSQSLPTIQVRAADVIHVRE